MPSQYAVARNSFEGGMNQDMSVHHIKPNQYFLARNMRLTTEDPMSIGAIENEKGNELSFSFPDSTNEIWVFDIDTDGTWAGTLDFNGGAATINITGTLYNDLFDEIVSAVASYTPGALIDSSDVLGFEYAFYENFKAMRKGSRIVVFGKNITSNTTTYSSGTGSITASTVSLTDQTIIGYTNIRDKLILFSTDKDNTDENPSSTVGAIWLLEYNSNDAVVDIDVSSLDITKHLIYAGTLDFSLNNEIKAISFRIDDDNGKVYWTDDYNNLRTLNVYDNSAGAVHEDNLMILPNISIKKPKPTGLINGGSYKSGVVYYAYQMYNNYGGESLISPISNGMNLSEYVDNLSDTSRFLGSPVDTNTGKAVKVQIDNVDISYDKIRIFSIFYERDDSTPVINIVADKRIRNSSTIDVIDDGFTFVGSLSLQELRNYNKLIFSCKDLAIKDNRLLCGNIQQSTFDVTYDARAYRHRSTSTAISPIFWSDDEKTDYSNVGEYDDCVLGDYDTYKFQADGSTMGGEGTNISYSFATVEMSLDNSINNYHQVGASKEFQEWSSELDSSFVDNEGYTNYASAVNSSQLVGYKRGETYRHGIVFRDTKGRVSPVKWIADIKYPEQSDAIGTAYDDNQGESYVQYKFGGAIGIDTVETAATDYLDAYVIKDSDLYAHTLTITMFGKTVLITIGGEDCLITVTEYYNALSAAVSRVFGTEANLTMDGSSLHFSKLYLYLNINSTTDVTPTTITLNTTEVQIITVTKTLTGSTGSGVGSTIDCSIVYNNGTNGSPTARILYPIFRVDNVPLDEYGNRCSYQIVRVKREERDMTRMAQGLLLGTRDASGLPDERYPIIDIIDQGERTVNGLANDGTGLYLKDNTLVNLINPLTSFRNFDAKSGDSIRVVSTAGENLYKSNGNTFVFKIKSIVPETYATGKEDNISYSGIVPVFSELSNTLGKFMVKNYTIRNLLRYDKENIASLAGTSLFLGIDNGIDSAVVTDSKIYMAEIVRSVSDQYGGNTYYERQNNEYVSCGHFRSGHESFADNLVFGGDTYIAYFDYLRGIWLNKDYIETLGMGDSSSGAYQQVLYLPVETVINLDYRYDKSYSKLVNDFSSNAKYLQEKAGDYSGRAGEIPGQSETAQNYVQEYDLYLENTAYSKDNDTLVYLPKLEDESVTLRRDTQLVISEEFNYDVLTDNFLRFLPSNTKILNSQYGPIYGLINYKDQLFVFQSRATGIQYINERSLVQDNTGTTVVLGSGDVLGQYAYISTSSGCSHRPSIVASDSGLYYFDAISKSLNMVTGKGEFEVSTLKGLSSYLERNIDKATTAVDTPLLSIGVHAIYDEFNKRILLTHKESGGTDDFTVSYNERLQVFEGEFDYTPKIFIKTFENRLLSVDPGAGNESDVYIHNIGEYGDYYGTKYASYIDIVVNPQPDVNKMFSAVELNTRVSTVMPYSYTDTYYNESIDYMQFYNDYQNSGALTVVQNGTGSVSPSSPLEIRRFNRKWRLSIPRYNDPSSSRDARFSSTYLFEKITYTNNLDKRFLMYDVLNYYYPAKY